MKHALKFISMVALLVAALAMASCGNPNSSSSAQQRAVYVANIDTVIEGRTIKGIETITFESDGSFVVHDNMTAPQTYDADVVKGTYTGNAAVDGKITITTTHMYNGTSLVPIAELEGVNVDPTGEVTISNGKFTSVSGSSGTSIEYVRQ
ncbi:MAG TPA: hypothetical protein DCQ43_06695 [Treponema sp.]|nr:hypothetical protein [Treponema sp.]